MTKKEIEAKIVLSVFNSLLPNWKGYKMLFPITVRGKGYRNIEIQAKDIMSLIKKSYLKEIKK